MTKLDLGDNFNTSNVTEMGAMFSGTGQKAMTSLNLGSNFNTLRVTNMNYMFNHCGYTAMTSLDLGDKFDTSNVTSMSYMFIRCGYTAMTTLDLGPNFTKIADQNTNFITNCGKSGAIIYAPESIYKDITSFKLNSGDTSTASGAISVDTGRTITPIYKPEWTKVSSAIDETNETLSVTV